MADISVADAAGAPAGGVFGPLARAQYAALIRLRWRMFSNGMRSNQGALELGARTFSYLVYGVIGLALGVGAGVVAYFLASTGKWRFFPILFWVLAFIWQMIPVMLASFQEQFDLGILLRFPVRFGSYYLLYLAFGLVDISTILGALCCTGVWVGVAIARPAMLPWVTLALIVFALFNILLVRAVFAWIERWLAQRRTREILGAVFMIGLLSLQLLNPALYQRRHSASSGHEQQVERIREAQERYKPWLKKANAVQKWLPPGLAAQSLRDAATQQPPQGLMDLAFLGFYSLLVGGVLGLRLKAEYRGENLSVAPVRSKAASARSKVAAAHGNAALTSLDRDETGNLRGPRLRGSGPIAAIMEKDIRALVRTLPLLYAIGAPLLLVLVFSGVFIRNGGLQTNVFPLALPVCMVYAQLGFTQVFYNNLGAEGAGIQIYFLSPTPFRTVMLAKNILHSCLFGLVATVAILMAVLRLGTPDAAVLAGTLAWLVFSLPCNLTAGNLFSIKMPYRVNPGRISRQRGSQANALLSLLVQLCILGVGAGVFALCWYLERMWLTVPIFLILGVGAAFVWRQVLKSLDSMAYGRRDALMATLMKQS
jgi:ABC-2 type transport system permease protein